MLYVAGYTEHHCIAMAVSYLTVWNVVKICMTYPKLNITCWSLGPANSFFRPIIALFLERDGVPC